MSSVAAVRVAAAVGVGGVLTFGCGRDAIGIAGPRAINPEAVGTGMIDG